MITYEIKGCVKRLLLYFIPIEKYIFSSLHTEIGVRKKIFLFSMD